MEIHAPSLLTYEVTNAFYQRIRKGEIPFYDVRRGLTEIIYKVIVFDFTEEPELNIRAMELGQQFGLPATYDSHYLALSESIGCELWTADLRMWKVVKYQIDWVHWIGDYSAP